MTATFHVGVKGEVEDEDYARELQRDIEEYVNAFGEDSQFAYLIDAARKVLYALKTSKAQGQKP